MFVRLNAWKSNRQLTKRLKAQCESFFRRASALAGWPRRIAGPYAQAWGNPAVSRTAALKKLGEAAYQEAQVQAFAGAL